ncbi:Class II abasic (AP) endonuclease [Serendipita sp. 396]|nr:Class II abasic (AP) endonuclease [Serendipita sp. 396]
MRILTWNINGIGTLPKYHPWNTLKNCEAILDEIAADIVCFQELKTSRRALDAPTAVPGKYDGYFSFPAAKGGYSGVAVYTNSNTLTAHKAEEGLSGLIQPKPPLSADERISSTYPTAETMDLMADDAGEVLNSLSDLDKEGRALVLDFGLFVLVNVYCVADSADVRYHFKMNYYYMLQERVRILLSEGREVIVLGDLNSCPAPIDHCEGNLLKYRDTFLDSPHRTWLKDWISETGPLVDIVRERWPERDGMYTCWNTKISARESNYGCRIDFILITPGLRRWVKHGDIQASVKGSDHCPVYIDLHDSITDETGREITLASLLCRPSANHNHQGSNSVPGSEMRETPRICARQWDEFSTKQTLLSAFFTKRGPSSSSLISAMMSNEEPESSVLSQGSSLGNIKVQTPVTPVSAVPSSSTKKGVTPAEEAKGTPNGTSSSQRYTNGEEGKEMEDGSHFNVQPPPLPETTGVNTSAMESVTSRERDQDETGQAGTIAVKPVGHGGSLGGLRSDQEQQQKAPPPPLKEQQQQQSTKKRKAGSGLDDSGQFKKQRKEKGPARSVGQATLASFFQKPGRTQDGEKSQRSGRESVRRGKRAEATVMVMVVDDEEAEGEGDAREGTGGGGVGGSDGDEDERFRRDLELAIALSQAQMRSSPDLSSPSTSVLESQDLSSSSQLSCTTSARTESKEGWSALLQPLQAPKCIVHGEPTKLFTVNKPGPNKGKTFYVCSRPVGPGYDMGKNRRPRDEVDSTYKCDFFKWASDVRRERGP